MSMAFHRRTVCPTCGHDAARVLLSVPFSDPAIRGAMEQLYDEVGRYDAAQVDDALFELNECRSCRLVFQPNVPGDVLMELIYNTWHDEEKSRARWTERIDVRRRVDLAHEVALAWNLARRDDAPLRVLDYGSGMGLWGGMALAFGAEAWGVEFSPARRARCAEIGLRMRDEAELPAGYFDYIQIDQVLEHLVDPRAMVVKLHRWLRPGGIVCIAVPQGSGVPRALRRWREEIARPNLGKLVAVVPLLHLNCFTHANLRQLAESAGLVRVRPPWKALWPLWNNPPGWRAKLKAFARPFYFRSRWTTRMLFRRPTSNHSPPD